MADFEIRKPDITSLLANTKKYDLQIKSHQKDFEWVLDQWNNLLVSTLELARKLKVRLVFSQKELEEFIEDNRRRFYLALCTAWALGREFAETTPEQAKYLLLIEDPKSDNILESTKKELLDLSDFARYIMLITVQNLHHSGAYDDRMVVTALETIDKMFTEGTFAAFQSGIASFYR